MGIFDLFKKKEPAHTKPSKAASEPSSVKEAPKKEKQARGASLPARGASTPPRTIREEIELAQAKAKKPAGAAVSKKPAAPGMLAYRILLRPIVSEKTTHLHSFNQYVFKVAPVASKMMVKKAIFEVYHEKPVAVKMIWVQGKTLRRGALRGQRSSYKKAIVKMPKGVVLPVYEGV